jgi:ADP-ribosylglycohydrolase
VSAAIGLGGGTHLNGALAGSLEGARAGASSIPQDLIDGLDARIYLTLAAPWFYQAARRRAGTVIDLRVVR